MKARERRARTSLQFFITGPLQRSPPPHPSPKPSLAGESRLHQRRWLHAPSHFHFRCSGAAIPLGQPPFHERPRQIRLSRFWRFGLSLPPPQRFGHRVKEKMPSHIAWRIGDSDRRDRHGLVLVPPKTLKPFDRLGARRHSLKKDVRLLL